MHTRFTLPGLSLTLALALAGAAHAEDAVVQAQCVAGQKQADLHLDKIGKGHVEVRVDNDSYSCELALASVEGPPFSDNATGMLVVEFDDAACTPKAAQHKLQLDVFLHISDPLKPTREGMAVIERRVGVFQCQIRQLDMPGLTQLRTQLAAKQPAGGK